MENTYSGCWWWCCVCEKMRIFQNISDGEVNQIRGDSLTHTTPEHTTHTHTQQRVAMKAIVRISQLPTILKCHSRRIQNYLTSIIYNFNNSNWYSAIFVHFSGAHDHHVFSGHHTDLTTTAHQMLLLKLPYDTGKALSKQVAHKASCKSFVK